MRREGGTGGIGRAAFKGTKLASNSDDEVNKLPLIKPLSSRTIAMTL